ncbi:MAG: hypothetical protein HKO56_08760 [Bacteroidia bacterium]|nr:hypothetical protein [Bacteroidia bacterium]NNC85116.1 hypothetical protein [Bacteroidia bacterium]NNM16735.1 hypothetical protein [Bacteroidia bacterium]
MNRAKYLFSSILFIFLLSLSFSAAAQSIKYSDPNHDFDGFDNVKIVGQDKDGFFLLQSNLSLSHDRERVGFRTRRYKVSYFNQNLQAIWTKKIVAPTKSMAVEHVEFIKNKMLTVYSQSKGGDLTLHIQWIDTKQPEKETEGKTIVFDFGKSSGFSKSRLILSKNQKKLAFVLTESNNNNEQVLHYAVLDLELNVLAQNKLKIADKEDRLLIFEYALSNNGDLLALADTYRKRKRGEEYRSESYKLLSVQANKNTLGTQTLEIDNRIIVRPRIKFNPLSNKGVLICLYYDKDLITQSGIYYTLINLETAEFENSKKISFENNLHIRLITSEYDNEIRGLSDYKIHDVILRNDGGAVIVAEAAYESTYSYYDYFTNSYTQRTEYYFANIFLASINADGTLDWYHVIKKSQYSRDDGGVYSSFVPMITSQEILMLLNTQMDRSNEVMAYGMNNMGDDYQKLLLESKEHIRLLPTAGKQITASSIVIPVLVKKKLALAKFEF